MPNDHDPPPGPVIDLMKALLASLAKTKERKEVEDALAHDPYNPPPPSRPPGPFRERHEGVLCRDASGKRVYGKPHIFDPEIGQCRDCSHTLEERGGGHPQDFSIHVDAEGYAIGVTQVPPNPDAGGTPPRE